MWLRLEHLSKSYAQLAVDDISLTLAQGEIMSLLGPSGCGKTTLLRLVAGLERPDRGRVVVDGMDITELPPHQRRFGLMFQEYALFPHLSVAGNVAFGLRMQRLPRTAIEQRVTQMLDLTGLNSLAARSVIELSGGERQRVALARSLAPQPRLLMLDEPVAALDRALRERLLAEIRDILKRLGLPAIFVTHDQSEAMAVADRIAVMHRGRLEQQGSAEALYRHPASAFVARFLGFRNLLPGVVTTDGAVATAIGTLHPAGTQPAPRSRVTLVLRPEAARLAAGSGHAGTDALQGVVTSRTFTGQSYRVAIRCAPELRLVFDLPGDPAPPECGQAIALTLNASHMSVMTDSPEAAGS
jgi:ABC-type Fe3+/spermidine/putrescine transport system ATPase subunit